MNENSIPRGKIRQFIELSNPDATRATEAYASTCNKCQIGGKDRGTRRRTVLHARFRRVTSFLGERRAPSETEPSKGDRSTQRCQLPRGVFPRPTDFIQPAPLSILIASTWDSSIGIRRSATKTADATNSKHLCKRRPSSRTSRSATGVHSEEHNCATMTMKICP